METKSIQVTIAGRTYPMTVKAEDVAQIQESAMLVNSSIKEYEAQYAVRDKQDLLAMCALQLANSTLTFQHQSSSLQDGVAGQLEEMEQFVSEYLKKN